MSWWPRVVDALEALWTPTPSLLVGKGQRPNNAAGGDHLVVAWDGDPAGGAMDIGTVTFEPSPVGNHYLLEVGTIRCALVCQDGAGPMTAVRDRLFALLSTLTAAVAADQTLGDLLPQGSTVTVSADVVGSVGDRGFAQRLDLIVTYTTPMQEESP